MSQVERRPANDPRPPQKTLPAEEKPEEEEELQVGSRFLLFNVMPSWMVSFLTHIAVIVILALLVMPNQLEEKIAIVSGEAAPEQVDDIVMDLDSLDTDISEALESADVSEVMTEELTEEFEEVALPEPVMDVGNLLASDELMAAENLGEMSVSNETGARTGDAKKQALLKNGGSQASEDAVQLALKWIVKHQLPDGGWNLDHTQGPGNHRNSPNPGTRPGARCGATALALLPLLGAGNTHRSGQYKSNVREGLEFLKKQARRSGRGVSFLNQNGDNMYSHGLVAIVFNECYAMTNDPDLVKYAQGSIWFIEDSQDPIGGGWRYKPRERGDTSAVGWQMMALKSGKIMGLSIMPRTYKRAAKFLDSVSDSNGAFYGYLNPPRGEFADARTAVGLLCRMYMGWNKDVPGLQDGVAAIAEKGPSVGSSGNMYYNYYATQVMKHYFNGESEWSRWNKKMRDFLVRSQEREGNAAGSWHFGRDHASSVGGRLYNTSLACMTLEVYYRFLPLYGDKAANDEFELIE